MPTASTAQILGNNECFEPFTSNIYVRRVLSGEFVVLKKYLIKTVWEIDQKVIVKMAIDRAPFIDQSQSMNLHVAAPNYQVLTNLHFMSWKKVRLVLSCDGI